MQIHNLLGVCVAQRETAMWCCVIQAEGLCVVALTRQFSPNKTPIEERQPSESLAAMADGKASSENETKDCSKEGSK